MSNQQIKEIILSIVKNEFDINSIVDIYDVEKQEFEFPVYLEITVNKKYYEIDFSLSGEIIKDREPDYYYNVTGDGRCGENQGGSVFIEDWYITNIETTINNELVNLITIEDLDI